MYQQNNLIKSFLYYLQINSLFDLYFICLMVFNWINKITFDRNPISGANKMNGKVTDVHCENVGNTIFVYLLRLESIAQLYSSGHIERIHSSLALFY